MTKRTTKREYFAQLLAINEVASNKELVGFIKHEMELLAKKNSSGKMTKTQQENVGVKAEIVNLLNENTNRVFTVTEITKILAEREVGDYTPQKISALMRHLVLDGIVERIVDKKRTVFRIVVEG